MIRRVPPALRRSRLVPVLLAGIAAGPLLAAALASDQFADLLGRATAPAVSTLAESPQTADQSKSLPTVTVPAAAATAETGRALPVETVVTVKPPAVAVALPGIVAPAGAMPLTGQLPSGSLTLPLPDFVSSLPPEIAVPPMPISIPIPRAIVPGVPEADVTLMKQALVEYRRGNVAGGDAIAAQTSTETARLALEWSVARLNRQALGFARLADFVRKNPELPMTAWVESRAADTLFNQKVAPERVLAFFGARMPDSAAGKVALARALAATGETKKADDLARTAYRDHRTAASTREVIAREFPALITATDQRFLIQLLIYEGKMAEGLALAAKAGPQLSQLAQLLAASINESPGAAQMLNKLDLALRAEPAALFAKAQSLRRTGKFVEAAQALLAAPDDLNRIVDGDEWWTERRMLSRKLLDNGEPELAYRVSATHHAESSANRVDAEAHSGWLALRFLNNPAVAAAHFAKARAAAETPPSLSRAEYWQGRAAEAMKDPFASEFYAAAGVHRQTYYGQLAMARIGLERLPVSHVPLDEDDLRTAANGTALRMIRALFDADARDLAQPLIFDFAKRADGMTPIVVLGDLLAQYRLPKLTLQAGKIASQRGMLSEEHAFPTFGIPEFEPAAQSAEPAIVYSIARQESEFDPAVISHAGARGLMQLMPATAMRTANKQKIGLEISRLTTDAALNARIGAAHLAELLEEYDGSYIMSFAAYNAGGKRVREWTNAYGDPRRTDIDKVDWIERIPITETRHYVQKILENLQVYRARIYGRRHLGIVADMERGARQPRDALPAAPVIAVR